MYLLFDIGGTKMRLAVSKDGTSVGEQKIVPTPQDFKEGMKIFAQLAHELLGGEKPKAVAGGIAGPLDKEHTMLVNSPNISSWVGKPLKKELEKMFEAPAYLENDTAMVGLGEVAYGAGKGYDIVVYITVSTGVGGARFVEGRIDRSAMGFEPGHQIIKAGGILCSGCGKKGHLEGYVSGKALEKRFGKPPAEIKDPAVWEALAEWLAIGLNNSIVHWSPDVVILGGSMITKEVAIPIDRIRFHLKKALGIFPEPPILVMAALEDKGGLYGGLAFLHQRV